MNDIRSAAEALSDVLNAAAGAGTMTVGMGDNELVVYIHRKLSAQNSRYLKSIAEMDGFPVRLQFVGQIRPTGAA